MEKAEHVFRTFDKDGDGRLSRAELEEAFEVSSTDYTLDEIDQIMNAMDSDKDSKIDINEWKAAALLGSSKNLEHSELKLQEAFKFFDTEGNGQISLDYYRKVLGNFDDESWHEMIGGVDKNKDGYIDF